MWVSDKVVGLFQISKDTVDELRLELATIKFERDNLKNQLAVTQTNFDWLRLKVNQLEMEKAALIDKAYGMKLSVPEIIKRPQVDSTFDAKNFSFDDVGEDAARKFGFPTYTDK